MKSSVPSFDDIIFDGRNKEYGAYELRRLTDRHNAYGLFITGSAFLLIVLLFNIAEPGSSPLPLIKPSLDVTLADLSHIKPQRPEIIPNSPPPPAVNSTAFTEFNPVATTPETSDIPTQEQLVDQVISTETVVTNTPNPVNVEPVVETTPAVTTTTPVNSKPVNWAPVMPSFVGGEKALREYLSNSISIAQADIENGVSGKVWVRFYVDVDGSVKDPTVIKDTAGGQCAERALQAIRKMPRWNPGMQNNLPVRVFYSIPIVFEVR